MDSGCEDLRQSRNEADYDRSKVVGKSQSEVALLKANNAVAALKAVPEGQFKAAINAIPTYNRTVEAR